MLDLTNEVKVTGFVSPKATLPAERTAQIHFIWEGPAGASRHFELYGFLSITEPLQAVLLNLIVEKNFEITFLPVASHFSQIKSHILTLDESLLVIFSHSNPTGSPSPVSV